MIHASSLMLPIRFILLLAVAAFVGSSPRAAEAQQFEELPPVKNATPPPAAPRPPQKAPGGEGGGGGAEAGLRQRVEQLEEQLVDMQVVIGTLESLARSGGAAPAPRGGAGGLSSSDAARVDGMETQIRALTTQIEQLAGEVRALGGSPRRTDGAPEARLAPQAATDPTGAPPPDRFGSTTVTPERGDPIGGLLSENGPPGARSDLPPSRARTELPPVAAAGDAPPPIDSADTGNPKKLYETAYGYLLQQNYKAAETAFDEFLKRYPNDSLSGNAQYWLGESHFVRGEYKAAAGAFLKGYETYASSTKAPDSLLKLAMSLDRLGQKEAACSSYSELATKFPNAAPHVKSRAQTERQRVGCP